MPASDGKPCFAILRRPASVLQDLPEEGVGPFGLRMVEDLVGGVPRLSTN